MGEGGREGEGGEEKPRRGRLPRLPLDRKEQEGQEDMIVL